MKKLLQNLLHKKPVKITLGIIGAMIALLIIGVVWLSLWDAHLEVTNDKQVTPDIRLNLQTADTKLGKVQYDMYGSQGPVVLSVHGGFGGADQGRLFASWLQDKPVRILSPSRPGYLGTPLSSGKTYAEQADLMVALLDALQIDKVYVVSYSAGGPVAYTLAERHPERVLALASIDSTSMYTPTDVAASSLIETSFGQKLVKLSADKFTASFLEGTLTETAHISALQRKDLASYIAKSPEKLDFFKATVATLFPYNERTPGNDNDDKQLKDLSKLPFERIHVPTLIVHDAADGDVPFYNGVYAYESISGAERYWMQGGGHLGFWLSPNSKTAQDFVWSFLQKHKH